MASPPMFGLVEVPKSLEANLVSSPHATPICGKGMVSSRSGGHSMGFEAHALSYDYSATIECLTNPHKPQYGGGIIVNPELNHGLKGWSTFGNAIIQHRESGGNKFLVAHSRRQPYASISQKLYLRKNMLYTFSAWIQVSEGVAAVSAFFKTRSGFKHAGAIVAEPKCWSMLKGGLTVDTSGPAELYFENKNTSVEIWVDSLSLQPFTQEEWSSHQQQSINKVRKTNVRIQALDKQGNPLQNATISIEQKSPSFPFGCAMNKNILNNPAYQNWFTSRFKVTTFENEMKWYSTEPYPGHEDYSVPDAMINFAKQHNIAVRAHNIFWDDPKYQPGWLNSLSPADLWKAVNKRITSIMSKYKGQVIAWDVVNENLHWNFFESKLGTKFSGVIYSKAHAFDGATTLFMNDYNTIEESGDKQSVPAKYLEKLREIQKYPGIANAKMAIGLEGHFNTPNLPYIRSSIDTLASAGLPIWLTEVDVQSGPSQCLTNPHKPQYGGGIIVNPELNHGLKGWSTFGNAIIQHRESGGNKFLVAHSRRQPYASISQKLYLRKNMLYTFSAWIQVSEGVAAVSAFFKTRSGFKHAGAIVAEPKCWSMLKGGLTVDTSGPAELYFESKNTSVEIWVDSLSLQPFTQEEWSSHQQQSINKVRKTNVGIQALDKQGNPLQNATISIEQKSPSFPFGCAMNKNILNNPAYQNWFTSRFKVTTFENEMKWYSTEPYPGHEDYSVPNAMINFAKQHNIAVRAHNIFWDDPKYQPGWLNSLSPADLWKAVNKRITSIMSKYKGQVIAWDVVNENLHWNFFESKLGTKFSGVIYSKAHAFDGATTLFMNDYNTIEESGDKQSVPAKYLEKLREIQKYPGIANAKMAIGLEGHFNTPNLPYIRSSIDTLASAGLPIWLTEVDVQSGPSQFLVVAVNYLTKHILPFDFEATLARHATMAPFASIDQQASTQILLMTPIRDLMTELNRWNFSSRNVANQPSPSVGVVAEVNSLMSLYLSLFLTAVLN
ncbi:hypothetical protein LWI28_017669 [Acer negundo]|uniref:GH10 domain-containing protein n=1 Tax=Acer negundo TaxID=4023 RepID=A0AAD5NUX9_ACENE|nr:hypothetical protein LWI28_017669 [Acer negundo]